MESKAPINFYRAIWHSMTGAVVFVIVWFGHGAPRHADVWLLAIALFLLALIDVVRFTTEKGRELFWRHLGFLAGDREKKGPTTSLYYAFSLLLCAILYPKEAVLGAIVCIALGDPAAMIVGKRFGRIRLGKKSIEGSLAGFLVCVPAIFLVTQSWHVAVLGSLAGSLIEFIPLPVDDNLTVPLFSGAVMAILIMYG
ncbi:MAG: SEC59/DGK1/VTE5 family protein [Candidatus Krumholzibacteria bacterium]|jgi:glycerol-3-phosphate acyltransferase PlsY|nr:SEC59/DGK1/VTE5 family protein [Candidatus Krumholzibacteria bacterium]